MGNLAAGIGAVWLIASLIAALFVLIFMLYVMLGLNRIGRELDHVNQQIKYYAGKIAASGEELQGKSK